MTTKTKAADKISASAARSWRAEPVRLDPEMNAVLTKAWRAASRAAAQSASIVVVKRS